MNLKPLTQNLQAVQQKAPASQGSYVTGVRFFYTQRVRCLVELCKYDRSNLNLNDISASDEKASQLARIMLDLSVKNLTCKVWGVYQARGSGGEHQARNTRAKAPTADQRTSLRIRDVRKYYT
jgi:hypothetical protein